MNTTEMRRIVVEAAWRAKHGHIPSALSIIEILKVYSDIETPDDIIDFK